ncbi:hypothetical protein [Brevibacillus daliensis]|uniref:hypothetical protein n=1 Tax=Brevibacillus daliensis TaxID=2892995 RepID=UPI001E52C04E|nr:hypothetical protein [Brevibacillus daliensis]
MLHVFQFLIALAIIGVQYILSRRNNVYWGAILPVVYVMTFVYLWLFGTYFTNRGVTFDLLLAIFGGEVVLLGTWVKGREALKKKRKKELEKMELQDI